MGQYGRPNLALAGLLVKALLTAVIISNNSAVFWSVYLLQKCLGWHWYRLGGLHSKLCRAFSGLFAMSP